MRLRLPTTIAAVAMTAAALAACGPPGTAPPPDPVAAAVAALPTPCPQTVTTFNEGSNPPCRPADHTGDGTGLPSQRLDMLIKLDGTDPTWGSQTSRCQGQTPQTGYGGQAGGFNLTTKILTCMDVDAYLVFAILIAPATLAA